MNDKELSCTDESGNSWRLALESQEKYPARHDLNFYFNDKCFHIQFFSRQKDALNLWELLKLTAKYKQEGSEDATITYRS